MKGTKKTAIVIGAGPAGLTFAYELLAKADVKPVIYEMRDCVGGIARTLDYHGNKIDIGGHRLFSNHDKINNWWVNFLPLQGAPSLDQIMLNEKTLLPDKKATADPEKTDRVMLVRRRVSRIFFLQKFFRYPLSEHFDTIINLGFFRMSAIIFSYIKAHIFPIRDENNLEDFFINRFGRVLYVIFFKKYTQKIWGVSCRKISPEWGYQRIKKLNIARIIFNSFRRLLVSANANLAREEDPGLVEKFMYPKLGIGQLWESVAEAVRKDGGQIVFSHKIVGLISAGNKITGVKVEDTVTGKTRTETGDYFISTMPVKDLIRCFGKGVSDEVREAAEGLPYRDFITVGLLLKSMKIKNNTRLKTIDNITPDNWIYVQDRGIKMGRIQIYNNWSPYMIKDIHTAWVGLEYFCSEGDSFWRKSDNEIIKYSIFETSKMGLADKDAVLDSVVIRTVKVYPAYFGSYSKFSAIRDFVNGYENLFLIGRNGMHRYNNMDDSMLTAMAAVDNIAKGVTTKENIWNIGMVPNNKIRKK